MGVCQDFGVYYILNYPHSDAQNGSFSTMFPVFGAGLVACKETMMKCQSAMEIQNCCWLELGMNGAIGVYWGWGKEVDISMGFLIAGI